MANASRLARTLIICGLWLAGAATAEAARLDRLCEGRSEPRDGPCGKLVSTSLPTAPGAPERRMVELQSRGSENEGWNREREPARKKKKGKKKSSKKTAGERKAGLRDLAVSLAHPPRTINDIMALLEEQAPARSKELKRLVALADQQPPSNAKPAELAKFLLKRGAAAEHLGRSKQQLEDLRAAEQYARKSSAKSGGTYWNIVQRLAWAENVQGNYRDSIDHAKRAVKIREYVGGHSLLVRLYGWAGDIESAQREYSVASWMIRQGKGGAWRKYHLYTINQALSEMRGKWAEAEPFLRRRIKEWKRQGFERQEPGVLPLLRRQLAYNLMKQGRLSEAEVEARGALLDALTKVGRHSRKTAGILGNISEILNEQGRHEEAARVIRAAIDTYQVVGAAESSILMAQARYRLAAVLVALEDWDGALAQFDTMRQGMAENRYAYERLFAGNPIMATALLKTGRAGEALEQLLPAYENNQRRLGPKHYDTAEKGGLVAAALAATGQREQALAGFAKAVPILTARSRGADSEDVASVARDQIRAFIVERYIRLLSDIQGTSVEDGTEIDALAEGFRLADAIRGRSVQRALAASAARAAAGNPELADLARREQDTLKQIAAIYGRLARIVTSPPEQLDPGVEVQLRIHIDTLRTARAKLMQEIEERFPEYAELINPKPATLDQARASLRPGEVLITFYSAPQRTYVWAVPAAGAPAMHAAPIPRAKLAAMVRQLRQALDPGPRTLADIPAYDLETAYLLYRELLAPIEAAWRPAKSLIVVAHGPLGQLPLSVLVTAPAALAAEAGLPFDNYRAVPWLARGHAVTVVPSVTSLTALRRLPPGDPARRPFVGFGDPYFSVAQAAEAEAASTVVVADAGATRGVPIALRSVPDTRQVDSAELALLPRLPDTADELNGIALALGADPTRDVFLGRDANEDTVKRMDLFGYKVLAFATHGLVPGDLNGLTQPALALSAPAVAGGDGDGLLTMGEILGLKLDADWAVLSACNTGSGAGAGAEAISGLGRAFFYAGARALLVSNWPVHSDAAKSLTTDMFRRQAADPALTRAEALRRAMLGLIDQGGFKDASEQMLFSYAHPLFWAPFSIIGDGG